MRINVWIHVWKLLIRKVYLCFVSVFSKRFVKNYICTYTLELTTNNYVMECCKCQYFIHKSIYDVEGLTLDFYLKVRREYGLRNTPKLIQLFRHCWTQNSRTWLRKKMVFQNKSQTIRLSEHFFSFLKPECDILIKGSEFPSKLRCFGPVKGSDVWGIIRELCGLVEYQRIISKSESMK